MQLSSPQVGAHHRHVKVWDPLVRLTHWLVAIGVLLNAVILEDGTTLHEYIGYTVVGLVVLRLIWGFVGTRYARFSHFWPTPTRIRHHIRHLKNREPETELGHNPLGALMMLALWATILGLGATGYMMNLDRFWGEEWVEELHEALSTGLLILVGLHIAAVIVMSHWSRVNLAVPMITGKKSIPKIEHDTEHSTDIDTN